MSTPIKTFTIELKPFGNRFQPTGFPDLGAATYMKPGEEEGTWIDSLHLESPQSMANHLEGTTWDVGNQEQVAELRGLPYVRVVNDEGQFITSSRLEAHRLASAYLKDALWPDGLKGTDHLAKLMRAEKSDQRGHDHLHVARQIFSLDPVSLVHGVFFADGSWSWQPKVSRALTVFIDAEDVRPAHSGGVKTDSYDTSGGGDGRAGAAEGYGMVPHQRVEYTARHVRAFVAIDESQIASYGLEPRAEQLIRNLIDFELASLFASDTLRLRTACMLQPVNAAVDIPSLPAATAAVQASIEECADLMSGVTEVRWNGRGEKRGAKKAADK